MLLRPVLVNKALSKAREVAAKLELRFSQLMVVVSFEMHYFEQRIA